MNPIYGQRIFAIPDPLAKELSKTELVDAMYELNATAENEALMLESETFQVMDSAYVEGELVVSGLVLDAVTTSFARFPRVMQALSRGLNRHPDIDVVSHEIGTPKKNAMFSTVTVQFLLGDGQVLSVIFHAPDEDPKVFKPDDMVIAFRWLLNKRDITHVVTPEMNKGKMKDVSLPTIAKRVGSLIAANSPTFVAKQADITLARSTLADLGAEQATLSDELSLITAQVAELGGKNETASILLSKKHVKLNELVEYNESLRLKITELEAGKPSGIDENLTQQQSKMLSVYGLSQPISIDDIRNKYAYMDAHKDSYKYYPSNLIDAVSSGKLKDWVEERAELSNGEEVTLFGKHGVLLTHDVLNELMTVNVAATAEDAKEVARAIVDSMTQVKPYDQLTQDMVNTLMLNFKLKGIESSTFTKHVSTQPEFINRKEDVNAYKKFKAATLMITDEIMEEALMNQVDSGDNGSEKPESVLTLENIVEGLHDDVAADDILEMIEQAAEQLEADGLVEQYDALIGSATEKYAELDEKQE